MEGAATLDGRELTPRDGTADRALVDAKRLRRRFRRQEPVGTLSGVRCPVRRLGVHGKHSGTADHGDIIVKGHSNAFDLAVTDP